MPERLTQRDRFARLTTPLGQDVLVLMKLDGSEAISENFEWRLSCLLNADEDAVEPTNIIGKPCHVELDASDGSTRCFHGLCTEIRFRGWRGEYMHYQLVLRPWTWLLTRETRSQIFHDLSVKDIITKIFNDGGFSDVEFRLQKNYDPIAYCVQYQETTYDFMSRLMEKFGMFFFFETSSSRHALVVVDSQTALPDIQGYGALRYQPHTVIGIREDRLFDWQTDNRLRTAVVEVDDYNYERPNTPLEKTGNAKDNPRHGYNSQRKYRFPAGHYEPGLGQTLADVLVDAERADAERKFAFGEAPLMHAGGVFKLADHPVRAENDRHFVVAARHSVFVQHFSSVAGYTDDSSYNTTPETREQSREPDSDEYRGEYELAEATKAYKTPMKTPWPRIYGAQTALVIKAKNSPADEEIDVDEQGRILVRFHWNDPREDSQASCRVRVAQIWAGAQWGGVWIPRVGMEAVVEFIEGDPDRPLVTGTVYNGNNKSPIAFPADKTQSTIKSNSSKGGSGFNELRFEDKKDDEEIYIHAERDRLMEIEHDDDITIGRNQTVKIGGNRTFELTGGDETVTLKGAPGTKDKYGTVITKGGHRTTTLEMGDETLTVQKGKRTTSIKMNDERTVTDGDDITQVSKGNQTTTVKMGNQTTKIDMGNQTTTLKLGNQTTKMSAGKGNVQAMQSYEIKVGGSSIKIDPMSITIKAMVIKIEASMMLDAKGLMTSVKGTGMLTLKGGMVMIN